MLVGLTDDECCQCLIDMLRNILPTLTIQGGAEEPFYEAPTEDSNAVLYFRDNYPRSLLHELSHYCLAGDRRRSLDDFGFWYSPCGRTAQEQLKFELVEARPQGLEKAFCEVLDLTFSPSLDDFSGREASNEFSLNLEKAYQEMCSNPPPTAKKLLTGLKQFKSSGNAV